VPTTWDETRFLMGDIGAMTNEQGRTLAVPLAFLGAGTFNATIYQDGADMNHLVNPNGRSAPRLRLPRRSQTQAARLQRSAFDAARFTAWPGDRRSLPPRIGTRARR
jgi:hypothetical protein